MSGMFLGTLVSHTISVYNDVNYTLDLAILRLKVVCSHRDLL